MANSRKDLKSLSDIFSRDNIQFIIPDYQRGYSWERDPQLKDLWEDLENMTSGHDHYTGMFTFCKDVNNECIYYLVDGQQRMTTLIILINELLKRITGPIDDFQTKERCIEKYLYIKGVLSSDLRYKFQYSVDDPSDIFFKTKILEQTVIGADLHPQKTLYTQNLQDAKEFFAEKIESLTQEKLTALFKKVTESLKFNEYLIEDIDEVYVTFETMNNRGKSLSTLELLKNRLIYLTTIYQSLESGGPNDADSERKLQIASANKLREDINNAWKTIYSYLGKSNLKKLSDDAFLRDHWIMYFRYDRKTSMVFKEDLLSKTYTAKRVLNKELKIEEIEKYVLSLYQSVACWFKINCPRESETLTEDERILLTRLNRVGIGSFRPLLMAAYLKGPSNEVIPLLEACERFRFLVSCVTERRSNTADYHFYGKAHDFFTQKHMTMDDIVNDINSQTNSWFNIQNFINASVDRYEKREGFYSWSGLRYFLYEYERELQQQDIDKAEKISWEAFENNQKGKKSIEHIYPQTPSDSYWTSRFDTQDKQALIHSLGNLLLLSVAKNSIEQNDSFDVKKKTTWNDKGEIIHHGYMTGSHSEIKVAEKDEWTSVEIIDRGKELLNFLIRHWDIDYTFTEEETNKLLNISSGKYVATRAISTQEEVVYEDGSEENLI